MPSPQPRKSVRSASKILTAYRLLQNGEPVATGFGRTVILSETSARVEFPDPISDGQMLSLEFLLNNNKIVRVEGRVTRLYPTKKLYRAQVEFSHSDARARRLIALQIGARTPAAKTKPKPKHRATRK